jgi:hypothetical protein
MMPIIRRNTKTAPVIALGTIPRETLKAFYIREACSAFIDALEFGGVDEDELIQELFKAKIKWDLRKTEEIPERVGSQS